MILLLSKENNEPQTEEVMEWLSCYRVPFFRLNAIDLIEKISMNVVIDNDRNMLSFGKKNIDKLNNTSVIWFRRSLGEHSFNFYENINVPSTRKSDLTRNLKHEFSLFYSQIEKHYSKKSWLNKPSTSSLNKLEVLKTAKGLNINIPKTLVTNNKSALIAYFDKNNSIISKPIAEVDGYLIGKYTYGLKNILVTSKLIKKLPDLFFPTLFQEYIEKEYEIRSFYISGSFYSMAIFSQNNNKTQIDYRNYDHVRPNRCVPYKLPYKLERKLISLFKKLDLNCGSVDIIKTKKGDYCFLEINPVGQYGWVSYNCNYNISKVISNYLSKKHDEYVKSN